MKVNAKRARQVPLPAPPAPTMHVLQEAALSYLDKSSCSVAHMKKLLERRILVWKRRAGKAGLSEDEIRQKANAAKEAAGEVIAKLIERKFLDDARFAQHRAERLTREGKSRRAVAAYLAQHGVDEEAAREATPRDDAKELGAAVMLLKKKRIGAFSRDAESSDDEESAVRQKWLGALARAGFSFSTAERVLRLTRESAEEILRSLD